MALERDTNREMHSLGWQMGGCWVGDPGGWRWEEVQNAERRAGTMYVSDLILLMLYSDPVLLFIAVFACFCNCRIWEKVEPYTVCRLYIITCQPVWVLLASLLSSVKNWWIKLFFILLYLAVAAHQADAKRHEIKSSVQFLFYSVSLRICSMTRMETQEERVRVRVRV